MKALGINLHFQPHGTSMVIGKNTFERHHPLPLLQIVLGKFALLFFDDEYDFQNLKKKKKLLLEKY